jgi:ketosteroid isomerase-like protein
MSRTNVEIVRAGYEAWNRGDLEGMFAIIDPEVEWQLPDSGMNTGTFRGHEGIRELMESYLEAFERFTIELEQSFEAGDRVVAFVRTFARGRASGIDVETRPAHVWTMRDGKGVRMEVFPERDQALAAAGI